MSKNRCLKFKIKFNCIYDRGNNMEINEIVLELKRHDYSHFKEFYDLTNKSIYSQTPLKFLLISLLLYVILL